MHYKIQCNTIQCNTMHYKIQYNTKYKTFIHLYIYIYVLYNAGPRPSSLCKMKKRNCTCACTLCMYMYVYVYMYTIECSIVKYNKTTRTMEYTILKTILSLCYIVTLHRSIVASYSKCSL